MRRTFRKKSKKMSHASTHKGVGGLLLVGILLLIVSLSANKKAKVCENETADLLESLSVKTVKPSPVVVQIPCGNPCSGYEVTCKKELMSRLEIGGNYTRVNLKRGGENSFKGNLGGVQASYEYRALNRFYGAATFSWKTGKAHHSSRKMDLTYYDAQEKLGYTLASEIPGTRLTLFSGFGYRHLGQKITSATETAVTYNYNELYLPTGFLTNDTVNEWFAWGIDVSWMPQIFSTVSIPTLRKTRADLKNTLNNVSVTLPLIFTLTSSEKVLLIFNPFYEHWQDGRSKGQRAPSVPLDLSSNTYNFYGAELDLAYAF